MNHLPFTRRWSWEEIFAALSREREFTPDLLIERDLLPDPLLAGGVPEDDGSGAIGLYFSDGSRLVLAPEGPSWRVYLDAAALPEVSWTSVASLPQLGVHGGLMAMAMVLIWTLF